MISIVVTGGIATGKSTVVGTLREVMGPRAAYFDCDKAAHELLTTEEISRTLSSRLGNDILGTEGLIDRGSLRELVFADEEKREILECLLHPIILQKANAAQLAALGRESGTPDIFLIEVPLFYEVDFPVSNDGVVAIATTEQLQIKRLREIRGLSDAVISDILSTQLPIAHKVERADFVIWNSGSPTTLRQQLELLMESIIYPINQS